MLAGMAGLELVHVPYKGEVPALTDMIAGRVDIFIGNIYAGLRFQQAGKVKFLGVADTVRSPVALGIPTVSEAGLPGFVAIYLAWRGSRWSPRRARRTRSRNRSTPPRSKR